MESEEIQKQIDYMVKILMQEPGPDLVLRYDLSETEAERLKKEGKIKDYRAIRVEIEG